MPLLGWPLWGFLPLVLAPQTATGLEEEGGSASYPGFLLKNGDLVLGARGECWLPYSQGDVACSASKRGSVAAQDESILGTFDLIAGDESVGGRQINCCIFLLTRQTPPPHTHNSTPRVSG